ncbi:MAG: MurR/RpiR family transcriptional regulator [Cellulosilyticaceae bacterium]
MSSNVFDNLTTCYGKLTRSEKKIADYIFSNRENVEYFSIAQLAVQCHVGEATIVRFCKSLGFGGYNEFKLALAKSLCQYETPNTTSDFPIYGKVNPHDDFNTMCQKLYTSQVNALSQTIELLDATSVTTAAQILTESKKVYCFGHGGSLIIAMEAWNRFLSISPKFFHIADTHHQAVIASLLEPGDTILFFSYFGATRDMLDILPIAKENGAKVIVVTHFPESPAASYADAILVCGSNEGPLQVGSVAAKVAQLMVIDVLFNQYWFMNQMHCTKNLGITAAVTAKKLL